MGFDDSDWSTGAEDFAGGGGDFLPPSHAPSEQGKGGWDVLQTVVVLLIVAGASFLISYLTRGQAERSAFLVGFTFFMPAVLVLLGALLVEWLTSSMTPSYSRKAQALLTLVASLLIFLTGFLGNLLYNMGFVKQENYIFVLDKSTSMASNDAQNQSERAIEQLIAQLPDNAYVGLVLFSTKVLEQVPIAQLDAGQREELGKVLYNPREGMTNFYLPLDASLKMLESNPDALRNPTRVIVVTDGFEEESDIFLKLPTNQERIVERCLATRTSVYCLRLDGEIDASLQEVTQETGGTGVMIDQATEMMEGLQAVGVANHDFLREDTPESRVILCIMLVIVGLILGTALTLMLSRSGQKRFQLLLSPLMAVCAFLVIKFGGGLIPAEWLREALGFSLLGIVCMRKNRSQAKPAGSGQPVEDEATGDAFLDF